MKRIPYFGMLVWAWAGMAFSAPQPPNVLFIAVDDLNTSAHIMEHRESTVQMPNLERLAKKGMLFQNAHCAAPACNPSRASVITGIAPSSSGVYMNAQDWRENKVLRDWTTIPDYFRQHGYITMGGGKIYHAASLSVGGYTGYMDPEPWDEYFPDKTRQMPLEVLPPQKRAVHGSPSFYGGRFDWAELDCGPDDMADAQVVAWASEQLKKKHGKPLFLACGIYRPHIPWYTPKQYYDMHPLDRIELPETRTDDLDDVPMASKAKLKTKWHQWLLEHGQWESFVRGYFASVSFTDDMLGRLLDALESGPNAGNTIVVLWSDHGYHLGQKQHWEKFALWEQTTRVPFIVAAPGVTRPGSQTDQPVSLLDIYPTLNELCGFQPLEKLDGESLVPLLKNPELKTGRAVVITQGYKNHAVRTDRWRYIRYEKGEEELYDQLNDPKNFTNLAAGPEYAPVIAELKKFLPKTDAEKDPVQNSQSKWNNKEKKK